MARPGSERLLQFWCLYWDEREHARQQRTDEHGHDALVTLFRGIGQQIEKHQHHHAS